MRPDLIVQDYSLAKNKRNQIKILAEINACAPAHIVEILESEGIEIEAPQAARKKVSGGEDQIIIAMRERGAKMTEIARAIDRSPQTVADRIRKLKDKGLLER